MLGLFLAICGFGACISAARQIKVLKRERHRLDRLLNRYNSTYKDDYDFYNGF
nr:MAG TPA: hypothetical protein [Bacteriophage sp.]